MALSAEQFKQFMAQMMQEVHQHLGSAQAQQNAGGSNAATLASALDARIGKFYYDPASGQTFEEWLKRYGNFIEEDGKDLEESSKVRLLIGKLGDTEYQKFANSILPDLPDKLEYKTAIDKLKLIFADSRSLFVRQYECFRLKQKPGEDIQSFTAQVNAACENAKLDLSKEMLKCFITISGLNEECHDLREKALRLMEEAQKADTELTLAKLAEEFRAIQLLRQSAQSLANVKQQVSINAIAQKPQQWKDRSKNSKFQKSKNSNKQNSSNNFTSNKNDEKKPNKCFSCGKSGHWRKDCKFREANEGMPPSTIFVEDTDVILPSTSQTEFNTQCEIIASSLPKEAQQMSDIDMNNFVRDLFANDTIIQRGIESNFIDEIFTEKPPKILKEYLFGHVIGEGSYSKVKEVLHVKSLMRRAVKIIKDKRIRKIPGGEQNVQREIEVLQQLSHPNVIKVVEIFRIEEKQKLYIVMEFCVCSLQQMLDNCPEKMLPEFQAHLYFTQLLDGLDFLHSKMIIHKDIKPGNLLLSLDGILKICDLGVAELLTSETEGDWCTLVQGTPKFQPPEIVSGLQRRFRGSLVDIWACGITLYNIVSGDYPFDGDVIMKLFENITNNPLKMPSNVELSADLEQLLKGMLQKEPERRWNSLRIRASKWFSKLHQIDNSRIVHVPPIKDIPAHRPISILNCLEQMYGQNEGEESEKEVKLQQHGTFEQIGTNGRFNHCIGNVSNNPNHHQQPAERQVKIEFEESEPILAGYSGNSNNRVNGNDDCGENGNEEEEDKVNVDDNYGGRSGNLQRQQQLVKISVARLRQILFIALCSLIVLASLAVLFLML